MTANLSGESKTVLAVMWCPQGRALSRLMWTLVMDELLGLLNAKGFKVIAYADNLVIIVKVSDLIQIALLLVQRWCQKRALP